MNFGRTGDFPSSGYKPQALGVDPGPFSLGNSLAAVRCPGLLNLDDDVDPTLRSVRLGQFQGWLAGFGADSINRMIDSVLAD